MSGYADLEMEQGEDFGLQVVWTDNVNESYKVCHPMRLQARASTGQTILDLSTVDQEDELSGGTEPSIQYSTQGGVVQIIVPASQTETMPVGTLFYDLFVSYKSDTSDFITGEPTSTVRLSKLIKGKIIVEGRVTKHV